MGWLLYSGLMSSLGSPVPVIGAGIVGLSCARWLQRGGHDVTIIDPEEAGTVDREGFLSKSRNMPFHGWDLKGRARYTIVGGVVVWEADRE